MEPVNLKVECIYEPRGELGLEGYQLGDIYRAQKVVKNGKTQYRIHPDDEYYPDYYETCSVIGFNRYFKVVE